MTAKTAKTITAADIRIAAKAGTVDFSNLKDAKGKDVSIVSLTGANPTGARGRLHPVIIGHAEKVLKAKYVAGSPKSEPVVTLKVTTVNAKGAKRSKSVVVPVSKARSLAGVTAKRGRLSAASLAKAAENYKA